MDDVKKQPGRSESDHFYEIFGIINILKGIGIMFYADILLERGQLMDMLSKEKRHKVMSHIRSKDTSIEVKLRKALWHKGYRYRKNYKGLPGRPDIVLTKQKIVIFCDGDFFHGKDWCTVLKPKIQRGSNPEFWEKKITRNMERDNEINETLTYLGWTVIRFWECDIKKDVNECVSVIEECIFDAMIGSDM